MCSRPFPIDASAKFSNDSSYQGIISFKKYLEREENKRKITRNFIIKFLTYTNGEVPTSRGRALIDRAVLASRRYNYKVLNTILILIQSPLMTR